MVGMPISTIVTWVMAEEGGNKQLVGLVRYMRIAAMCVLDSFSCHGVDVYVHAR
jgi:hypothetical protein